MLAGPGPASSLDGTNVVFGKVLQGMDTVARVTGNPHPAWRDFSDEMKG